MTVNYNYTGYYAIQVNYLHSNGTYLTDEFSNIPGNSLATSLSSTSASLTVTDQISTGASILSLTGYNSFEIISTNVIMYYDVQISYLNKIITNAIVWTIKGNINTGRISGLIKF